MTSPSRATSTRRVPTIPVFRQHGTTWSIAWADQAIFVRDSKGLRYISVLLAEAGRRIPAGALTGGAAEDGPAAERARLNVTRAIRTAIRAIQLESAVIGRHLDDTIITGSRCLYAPPASVPAELETTIGHAKN